MIVSAPSSQLRPYARRKHVEHNPVVVLKAAELAQINQYRLLSWRNQPLVYLRQAIQRSQEGTIPAYQLSPTREDFRSSAQLQRFENDARC
jgi:hypothetical protein